MPAAAEAPATTAVTSTTAQPTPTAAAQQAPGSTTDAIPTPVSADPFDLRIDSPLGSTFLRDIGIDSFLPLGVLLALTIGALSAGLVVARRRTPQPSITPLPDGPWSLSAEVDAASSGHRAETAVTDDPSTVTVSSGAHSRHRLTSV